MGQEKKRRVFYNFFKIYSVGFPGDYRDGNISTKTYQFLNTLAGKSNSKRLPHGLEIRK